MTNKEIANETSLDRLRRKRDQAYDLAGCARLDRDMKDAERHTNIAKKIEQRIGELVRG